MASPFMRASCFLLIALLVALVAAAAAPPAAARAANTPVSWACVTLAPLCDVMSKLCGRFTGPAITGMDTSDGSGYNRTPQTGPLIVTMSKFASWASQKQVEVGSLGLESMVALFNCTRNDSSYTTLKSGRLPGISDVFALEPAVTALVKSAQTSNAYIMCIVEIVFVMLAAALWVLDLVTVLKRDGNSKPSRYALLLLGKTVARLSWTGPVSEMLTIHNLSKALPTKAVFQIGCLFTCCLVLLFVLSYCNKTSGIASNLHHIGNGQGSATASQGHTQSGERRRRRKRTKAKRAALSVTTEQEDTQIESDNGGWQTVKDRVRPALKMTTGKSATASTEVPANDNTMSGHTKPGHTMRPITEKTSKHSSGSSASRAANSKTPKYSSASWAANGNNIKSANTNSVSTIRAWRSTPPLQPVNAALLPAEAWPSLSAAKTVNTGKTTSVDANVPSAAPLTTATSESSHESAAAAESLQAAPCEPKVATDAAVPIEQVSNNQEAYAVIDDILAVAVQPPAAATHSLTILPAMDLRAASQYKLFEFGNLPNLQSVPTLEIGHQLGV